MTTRIRTLLGSILLLMATMAAAQTVHVTVPFPFVAGSKNLPAGDYTIELNRRKGAMILRSEDRSGKSVMMLANNSDWARNPDKTYAIFQRYGAHYFLAEAPARPSFGETWNENWRASTPRLKWPESKLDSRLGESAIDESLVASSSAMPAGNSIDSRFMPHLRSRSVKCARIGFSG